MEAETESRSPQPARKRRPQKARQDRYRKTEKGIATRSRCYREWFERNRENRNAYMREWRKKTCQERLKTVERKARYKRRYKMTHEDYEALLAAQGGTCALCSKTPKDERFGRLNIDHCHETGRVRGLLCTSHNLGMSLFGDSLPGFEKAVAYLSDNPAKFLTTAQSTAHLDPGRGKGCGGW